MAAANNVIRLAPGRTTARARTRRVLPTLGAMWRAVTTRRMLRHMADRMLADIGISRAQAAFEADRLPWDMGGR